MHEHRALAQLGEERLAIARGEAGRHHGHPRVLLQLGPVERGELAQLGQVEQAGHEVDLVRGDVEPALQLLEHLRRARARDLDAHRIAEAAAAQLELDRLQQVVGLVGDREVGVARDAESRALDDLHQREEPGEEVPDHALERHEQAPRADREKARQQLGDLHARETLLSSLRVADEQAEAQREPGDVRERLSRPDRERGQDGKDLGVEDTLELLELIGLEILDLGDDDPLRLERRPEVALPELRLLRRERRRALSDLGERGLRRQPVRRAHRHARCELVHQPGDPDHEELVHVRGEDRAEVDALEQRHRLVAGDLKHPPVEVELRQLSVEEPGLRFVGGHGHERLSSLAAEGRGLRSRLQVVTGAAQARCSGCEASVNSRNSAVSR